MWLVAGCAPSPRALTPALRHDAQATFRGSARCAEKVPSSGADSEAGWGAVAFSDWGTTAWVVSSDGQETASIARHHDPGGNASRMTFPAAASWTPATGVLSAQSTAEVPPFVSVEVEGKIRPGASGGVAIVHESDRAPGSAQVSTVALDAVLLLGRGEVVFSRLATMYGCAGAALAQAGFTARSPASGTSTSGAVPADADSIVGEWSGLVLTSGRLLTFRSEPGGKSALAVTRANGDDVTTDLIEGPTSIAGKTFSFGGDVLQGELEREWGAGFGHAWLREPNARSREPMEAYFFMRKDSAWMSATLKLEQAHSLNTLSNDQAP